MTLVILAAGMGSRYGGLKQIEPITEDNRFIIDFSIFDAIRAGFNKVVFVIKKENHEIFKNTIGKRFENNIEVEYAFQSIDDLPKGFMPPPKRTKPWGTAHAVYAARNNVNEPFAVINADDFYGMNAFQKLADHFSNIKNDNQKAHYCMIGYRLKHTLTENGSVSRGVCNVSEGGKLLNIVERTKIIKKIDSACYVEDGTEYDLDINTTVSMNCWGFTPDIFDHIKNGFSSFLEKNINELKSEYYLPFAVKEIMDEDNCDVAVYNTPDVWYGVTYKEDKDHVKKGIQDLIEKGIYKI